MPRKTSRYTEKANAAMEIEVLAVLTSEEEALTIEQIQQRSISLGGVSSQKMARVLAKLIEMGFVRKGKSKSQGRMLYKAASVMEEQGYDISDED